MSMGIELEMPFVCNHIYIFISLELSGFRSLSVSEKKDIWDFIKEKCSFFFIQRMCACVTCHPACWSRHC